MKQERSESEIEAVDDVHVEGFADLVEPSRTFYREYLGLLEEEAGSWSAGPGETELRFLGQRRHLVLRLKPDPQIDHVKRSALICVKSLDDVADRLGEQGISYQWSRALGWAGRRLLLADPSGNLLELRQETLL